MSQSVFSQEMANVTISERNSIITIEAAAKNNVFDKSTTKKLKDKPEVIYYDISDLNFISEIDLTTNSLKITSKDGVTYDKAQLTNMETKNTFAKIELSSSNNTMSLENIKPGKYMLILSNAAGEIRSQELFIF
jgi:hypothetical protein